MKAYTWIAHMLLLLRWQAMYVPSVASRCCRKAVGEVHQAAAQQHPLQQQHAQGLLKPHQGGTQRDTSAPWAKSWPQW
jgi:hypothetical protein